MPVFAGTLTLTFNDYCDELSGWCTVPDQSGDLYPVTGTTTVVFDDTITSSTPSLVGLADTVTYGTPFLSSTLTETLPFAVCTAGGGSATLQTPTEVYPGATSSFSLSTACTGDGGLSYSLDLTLTLDAILDPTALFGDLRSLQASGQPFSFSERETLTESSVFLNAGYASSAYLVRIEKAPPFQKTSAATESRTFFLSLVPLAWFGLKLKRCD